MREVRKAIDLQKDLFQDMFISNNPAGDITCGIKHPAIFPYETVAFHLLCPFIPHFHCFLSSFREIANPPKSSNGKLTQLQCSRDREQRQKLEGEREEE